MPTKKNDNRSFDLGNYASRHPRRMYSSMLAAGAVLGAGLMAAKAKRDHDSNPLNKLLDQLKHD